MAINTLQNILDGARGYLHDTQVAGGEVWTNTALQIHFNEAYRRMWNCLMGLSKRVQRIVYVNLPAQMTVLIPSAYNITDFGEPEIIEERTAGGTAAITGTSAATPIVVNAVAHGLGTAGQIVEGVVSGVSGTPAPWGHWFATIVDADHFSLNGSVTDTLAGTGGTFTLDSQLRYTPVLSEDLADQCIDGQPGQNLGCYLWINEQLQFRGATGIQQLRITYWASGTPPVTPSLNINIDNCIDFLACATAANAARANGWSQLAQDLRFTAFGDTQQAKEVGGLLGEFVAIQVRSLQRGPQRRMLPFRDKISKFGQYIWGSGS